MKIHINPEAVDFENLKHHLVNEFPRIRFWELPNNFILAEKNNLVGCYIVKKKKSIRIISGFPCMRANIIAIIIVVLGGFIVPLALYFTIFHPKQSKLKRQLGETIAQKYSKFQLLNKTEN